MKNYLLKRITATASWVLAFARALASHISHKLSLSIAVLGSVAIAQSIVRRIPTIREQRIAYRLHVHNKQEIIHEGIVHRVNDVLRVPVYSTVGQFWDLMDYAAFKK